MSDLTPRLRSNVIANFVGRAFSMVLAILFTPLYIKFLGIEAYGLIGFYITMQASIGFLEMGLSHACNRELARLSGLGSAAHKLMKDTLRSLEVIYWCVALLIGVCLSVAAPWIAQRWLNDSSFATARLEHVLLLVAWVIALRWPFGLYNGALMGLQRQVLLNVILVALSVLNWGGSVLILWLVQADIEHFFQWQVFGSIAMTAIFGLAAWHSMPKDGVAGHFSFHRIKAIIPFATGVASNAILGTVLTQADKLIVSALFPLKIMGYYMVASLMAGAIPLLAHPIYNGVFPCFSKMVGANTDQVIIKRFYHVATQFVSLLILPVGLTIAFFSRELLYVYTGDFDLSMNTAAVLTILAIAKLLHAEMLIPYALQLAFGWVRLSVYINIASVVWIVPSAYVLGKIYGLEGVAFAWLVVSVGYVFIGLPLMHRRFLVGEWVRWARDSLMIPIIGVGGYLMLCRIYMTNELINDRRLIAFKVCLMGLGGLLIAASSMPAIRQRTFNRLSIKSIG